MLLPAIPSRLLAGSSIAGVIGGATLGFVRGLDYLPTPPFAVVDGGFLIGIPATVLGLILVAAAQLRWHALALAAAEVLVGGAALVLSVVMTAGRTAHANSFLSTSGGSTTFGAGSGLSLLAAFLLLAAALVVLIRSSRPARGSGDT